MHKSLSIKKIFKSIKRAGMAFLNLLASTGSEREVCCVSFFARGTTDGFVHKQQHLICEDRKVTERNTAAQNAPYINTYSHYYNIKENEETLLLLASLL